MVIGGIVGRRISRSTALYDPMRNRWMNGAPTHNLHTQESAVTLPNGRILIAGGYGGGPEVYNQATRTWTAVASTPTRTHPVMATLGDGEVLLATGVSARKRDFRSAQIFDAHTGTWRATGALQTPRDAAVGAHLPNGDILVAGGEQVSQNVLASTELFHPATGTWTGGPPLQDPRDAATLTTLRDGNLLVCGGTNLNGVLNACEMYVP